MAAKRGQQRLELDRDISPRAHDRQRPGGSMNTGRGLTFFQADRLGSYSVSENVVR
jgi:hypothetical protein